RQRIVDDRQVEVRELLQAPIAAGHQRLALANIRRIELPLIEWALDDHRLEVVAHDELGERWVAAKVPLARCVQRFRIEQAHYIAQIKVAVSELLDVTAAYVAEIAFFALGHFITPTHPPCRTTQRACRRGTSPRLARRGRSNRDCSPGRRVPA